MERARPSARGGRRIPAFGEWNHHSGDDDDGNGTWPAAVTVTPFFDLAAVLKAAKTLPQERRDAHVLAAAKRRTEEPHGQRRRSKVADSGAYAARKTCFTTVKAVDDDLYDVPPDMIYQKPPRERGWLRILLAGCFCPRGTA